MNNSGPIEKQATLAHPSFIADYLQLVKFRLTSMVVFSSAMGYMAGLYEGFSIGQFILLLIGGFLVTGSANGINQVIEREFDKLMTRTANRPVAAGRISVNEATIVSIIMGISGVAILGLFMHPLAGVLGFAALVIYAFVYTPLKRITSWNVVPGAIAGSLPVLIGYVVATGTIDLTGIFLFEILFFWQFPHTWAIGWLLDEDYKLAGFKMTPRNQGKAKLTAAWILIGSVVLFSIPIGPVYFGWVKPIPGALVLLFSAFLIIRSIRLFRSMQDKDAKRVMLTALLYLPLALVILVLGLS